MAYICGSETVRSRKRRLAAPRLAILNTRNIMEDIQLVIPVIAGEEELSTKGAEVEIKTLNWERDFPYRPQVRCRLGHDGVRLWCRFEVSETHVRVRALEDNGNVWEDSCVELFIGHPDGVRYYNFETNAGGTPLGALRYSQDDFVLFTPEEMGRLFHRSSLPREVTDIRSEEGTEWSLVIGVPFSSIGYREGEVPEELRINLYKCGDLTDRQHYVSWLPIVAPKPQFHSPAYFGRVRLERLG